VIDGSPPPLGFGEVQAADLTNWQGRTSDPQWTRFANAVYSAARGRTPEQQAAPQPQPAPSAWRAATSTSSGGVQDLTPVDYVKKCLRLYFDGKGRARRAEYWWWALFAVIATLAASMLDIAISGVNPYTGAPNAQVVYVLVALALLGPGLSVLSRRFHDVGLSGWLAAAVFGAYAVGAMMTAAAMPIGLFVLIAVGVGVLVVALIPSKPGANQYGPNPKGA
jgi:uncharacterized membrane protein YhaH (DUF805 family)